MNFRNRPPWKFWLPLKYSLPLAALALLGIADVILRLGFGLGNPPLLQADPEVGYRFQPNQRLYRFGRRIEYNQYSQRSAPIQAHKPPQTFRILMIGDSVLNGGIPTDQSETITSLLQTTLQNQLAPPNQQIEVLNASAGSWGIGNHWGYIRQFGLFQSDLVILELANHDLFQPTSTADRVGRDPNYPDHRPILAMQELFQRYLLPRSEIPPAIDAAKEFEHNQKTLHALLKYIQARNIPVMILYVPELHQLLDQQANLGFYPDLLTIAAQHQVKVIDFYTVWGKLPSDVLQTYYRDNIHLTVPGNQAVADRLHQHLCASKKLQLCRKSPEPW